MTSEDIPGELWVVVDTANQRVKIQRTEEPHEAKETLGVFTAIDG